MSYNNNQVAQNSLDNFCKIFYSSMNKGGISEVLWMFDQQALCTIDQFEMKNPYEMVLLYARSLLHRIDYHHISATSQTGNGMILVNVVGTMSPINYNGTIHKPIKFSDTFIMKQHGYNNIIINYVMKTFE